MTSLKHAIAWLFTGLFLATSTAAHAGSVKDAIIGSDPYSSVPLVIFGVSAVMVYLCNRPRTMIGARVRRYRR